MMTYAGSSWLPDEVMLTRSGSDIHPQGSSGCTAFIPDTHVQRITVRRSVAGLAAPRHHHTTFKEIIPRSSGAEELPASFESDVHVEDR